MVLDSSVLSSIETQLMASQPQLGGEYTCYKKHATLTHGIARDSMR
jgi:hypothetical protein